MLQIRFQIKQMLKQLKLPFNFSCNLKFNFNKHGEKLAYLSNGIKYMFVSRRNVTCFLFFLSIVAKKKKIQHNPLYTEM